MGLFTVKEEVLLFQTVLQLLLITGFKMYPHNPSECLKGQCVIIPQHVRLGFRLQRNINACMYFCHFRFPLLTLDATVNSKALSIIVVITASTNVLNLK